MRLMTTDGRFGFLIAALPGRDMFRFQMLIDGQVIGDAEPCILGTAMRQLAKLAHVDDAVVSDVLSDTQSVLDALNSDDRLHDATMRSLAESMDRWSIRAYIHASKAVWLAQEYRTGDVATGPISVAVTDLEDYDVLIEMVHHYWSKNRS